MKLIEILAKKAATPEEKQVQALIKSALLSDNLSTFIKEVELASQGIEKVRSETVKGLVEYAWSYKEAQIRVLYGATDRVEAILEQENNRSLWRKSGFVGLYLISVFCKTDFLSTNVLPSKDIRC